MATLWHILTRTLNVQGAVRRVLAQTHVLRRKTVRFVIALLLNSRNSWPTLPTEQGKSIRRRQAVPPDF